MRIAGFLLTLVPLCASAGTISVTTTADSGPGSLRDAIIAANWAICAPPCRIEFRIPSPVPSSGYYTIRPTSPLPVLESPTTIDGESQTRFTGDTNPFGPEIEMDGTDAGARSGIKCRVWSCGVVGLAINRFKGHGVFLDGVGGSIFHNVIGADPTGSLPLPNEMDGIALRDTLSPYITENIISGNRGNGIYVDSGINILIRANSIGIGRSDTFTIPNGASGIHFRGDPPRDYRIGDIRYNRIAHNALFGITLDRKEHKQRVNYNSIFDNGLAALEVGFDGRDSESPVTTQSAPRLTHAVALASRRDAIAGQMIVRGTIRSKPNRRVQIEVFASPTRGALGFGDAKTWIAETLVDTDANGNAFFEFEQDASGTIFIPGGYATASATSNEDGTSELSEPIPIVAPSLIEVTTTDDSGKGSLRAAIERANATACSIESPCWISFRIAAEKLTRGGVARIEPRSPLPPIVNSFVFIDGASQTWSIGDTNETGPEVEIRGLSLDQGNGLEIGTDMHPSVTALIRDIAVNGFPGHGVQVRMPDPTMQPTVFSGSVKLANLVSGVDAHGDNAIANRSDGVSIEGGIAGRYTTSVTGILSGNGRHGISIRGSGHGIAFSRIGTDISGKLAIPNGGSGVYIFEGSRNAVASNLIAFNAANGVTAAPAVRSLFIVNGEFRSNGGLPIDRGDDGPTPLIQTTANVLMEPPEILDARYDAQSRKTIVRWQFTREYPPGFPYEYYAYAPEFYAGSAATDGGRTLIGILGEHFSSEQEVITTSFSADLRGSFINATINLLHCFFELGCTGLDSSEFGKAMRVTD